MVSAGQVIRASDVAVQACRVGRAATQSIPNTTNTLVAFDTEDFDTNGMHSTTVNNSRITIQTAGIYVVSFTGQLAGATTYVRTMAMLYLNGANVLANDQRGGFTANVPQRLNLAIVYQFDAGDFIEIQLYQDSGASRLLEVSDLSPWFAAARIGS